MRKRNNGKNRNLCRVIAGTGVAVLSCFLGALLAANLTLNGRLNESAERFAIPILLAISTIVGGVISGIGKQKTEIPAAVGCMIVIVLLLGSLLLDGQYAGVVSTLCAVGTGTIGACIFCLKKSSNRGRKKSAYR